MPASSGSEPFRILQLNSLLTGGGTDDQCLKLSRGLMDLSQDVWLAGPAGRELSATARELGVRFVVKSVLAVDR